MTVALIYPPACDPTAPYLSVPLLTGVLRSRGVTVLPVDANVEAFDALLRQAPLARLAQRIQKRWARLTGKRALGHTDQLLYLRLTEVMPDLEWVPEAIADALAVLRDGSGNRFYDPVQYEKAVGTVMKALALISAAYSPLEMDFTAYRTPFALLSEAQVRADARPANNPFHDYFSGVLVARLAAAGVTVAGISLAFPAQIQPGFTLAHAIKNHLPAVHVTVGGPAATQLMGRFDDQTLAARRGPFDSVVLFEGETALMDLVETVAAGRTPPAVIHGTRSADLAGLPAPDFSGLPLEKYFSPEPVLPYDPTRGCYWGRCAFCHYGLSHRGTAPYRQRPVGEVVSHLRQLSRQWGCRTVYFSQDAFAPTFARQVATALRAAGADLRWGSDMRPESSLTPDCCRALKAGGALSVALGIESAAPRLIRLIDKGVTLEEMTSAATHLAEAGIAVEAMCFTDFPTESRKEALATLAWLRTLREKIALFICGRFGLSHGSRVATSPAAYGIDAVWYLDGDHWQTGLFYRERRQPKTDAEREALDDTVDELSAAWWLHDYPWAGALSTAHTLLYYAHGGPDVFKRLAVTPRGIRRSGQSKPFPGAATLDRLAETALRNEADIWHHLVHDRRSVSPALYARCAAALPAVRLPTNAKSAGKRRKTRRRSRLK
jgi:anaerobic magnesium-protoporphyrin IX monomethyl ester cyclase